MVKISWFWSLFFLGLGILLALLLAIGVVGEGSPRHTTAFILIISCAMASGGFLSFRLKAGEPITWDELRKKRVYEICNKLEYSENLVDQTPDLIEMIRRGGIFSSRKIVRVPLGYWKMFHKGLQIMPEEDGSFWYVFSELPARPPQKHQEITVEQT